MIELWTVLVWVYIINAMLLIVHEIDSAYWHEWKLFRIPGGITVFLALHFPLVLLILYGLMTLAQGLFVGLLLSLALGAGGIFAFAIHSFFIWKGRVEFRAPMSLFILASTLVVSAIQVGITIVLL